MKTGTVRGFRRLFVRYAAITLLTTTVLSVGIAGTASAASATLTPVGSFATTPASSTGLTTANATLVNPGDVLAIWVQARAAVTAGHVTGITATSGPGAIGTAVKAIAYTTVDHGPPYNDDEIWYAPVTTAGAVTLTFAWSGTTSGVNFEYSTQEFQPSSTATYTTDAGATSLEVSAASGTVDFPSVTPTGAGELYLGYNSNNTSGAYTSPTTSGYTPESGGTGDAIIFNGDAGSGAQAPSTTATSGTSPQSAIGAMIIATATTGYTVTFNANGGTGTMTNETATTSTALTANGYIFTGHTFTGWNTLADGTGTAYAPGANYPFTSSTTLYAQWTANTNHTVTFDANTGTGTQATETHNTATALTLLSSGSIAKTGFTFTGWNTLADGTGTAYADGASYPFSASTTLYAQWTVSVISTPPTSYTVTFNGNGSTGGSMATETDSAATALTANAFTRTGYTFAGWNTAANGSGTSYANGASYPFTASATLYAHWTAAAPHASSVVGGVVAGGSRVLAIIGTGFFGKLRVITNGPGATVHVLHASATRIVLWVRVSKTSRPGRHTFTIITVSGKRCTIGYLTK